MKYLIIINKRAERDINLIIKSGDKGNIKKLKKLLEELETTPREGTGQPEQLKYQESEIWSRKLNKKDRLVYEIKEDVITVFVLSSLGHYDDK